MIASSVLNPPGEYLSRFLAGLRNLSLIEVHRDLRKIDEFRENASLGPPTHYELDQVQNHQNTAAFETEFEKLLFAPSKLQHEWAVPVGSCADVKPIIYNAQKVSYALIGCHNGNLVCCHLESGKYAWRRKLISKANGFTICNSRLVVSETAGFVHIIEPVTGDFIFSTRLGTGLFN